MVFSAGRLAERTVESCLVLCLLVSAAAAQTFPKPVGRINDFAGVLDPAAEQEMDTLLATLENDTASEVAVVTVDSLDQIPVEEYANKLFNEWGIGQRGKDNGVLVLVAPSVREMRIEVGYGLEGVLPDGLTGSIIREQFVPAFRDGNYQSGIVSGVRRIAAIVRRHETLTDAQLRALNARTGPPVMTLPAWALVAFLAIFVAPGAYIVGLGIGARVITFIIAGLVFAGLGGYISFLTGSLAAYAHLPIAAGMIALGLRNARNPKTAARLRGRSDGKGWMLSSKSRAGRGSWSSSSRSGGSSGGSFGGGRSGGGGASGRW
jgi:uncharacterized protein